jgi:hypothetical protein
VHAGPPLGSVNSAEERRRDILRIRCIRFFKEGRVTNNKTENLREADCCSITFELQKKDEKMDTVTQLVSGDSWLCPVKSWVQIVKRILSYPGANEDMPVSTVWRDGMMIRQAEFKTRRHRHTFNPLGGGNGNGRGGCTCIHNHDVGSLVL